ncbi:uracil-DNA glycosylase family protein [Sulfitobacter donghicola]|uniref:Uracil-DNA glycosylase n=1 Tax=Sulfitobacter donghicola DSW-25 = KCTC 12864 = JCM 14565 TaxID=1300350 RepID=A0A073IJR9_9RHOB|nr:uracil-DNA glycosylase family protein [Sulfitobacter donghicola]KEJ89781.1 uracil-DNA glycosylase [Sulfitobacter donghicola DSW-25 = KCTC 12864 = JCM 14565]KIN67113.1 Uracil-DNA glycosylase [Sulfitobacter donghicola DSW-25 = KCTC 12864 = JCM 14565]
MTDIRPALRDCKICSQRFAATATAHHPNPVVWFQPQARMLIAGQAPGMKVHKSGRPFTDPSGDRLRSWLGLSDEAFYDRDRVAILPMAFCFPGYNAKGSDLPPPPVCAKTWRGDALAMMPNIRLKILIGGHAMKYHLPDFTTVTQAVADWQNHPQGVFALPHPSWRNTGWLRKNPWFEAEVIPRLQAAVKEVM